MKRMLRGILIQTNTLALNLTICLHGKHDEFSAAAVDEDKIALFDRVCVRIPRIHWEQKLKLLIVRKVLFCDFRGGKI